MNHSLQSRSVLSLALVLAAGCSTGGGGSSSDEAPLTIAVTDAASDELTTFVLEIDAIELTRLSGGVVGVQPAAVTLDLVTLSDASQVLNMQNVPPGAYQAASVTIDFGAASCYLIGETDPATIYDSNGQVVTGTLELPIEVAGTFTCAADRHTVLELDFDLNQSVLVDTATNSVILEPAFVMRVDRTDPKEFILAGALQSVDEAASSFVLEVQTLDQTPITTIVVTVDEATVYQVDGIPSQGATGLTSLSTAGGGTWVQCYGALDSATASFAAQYLEAGTGTYNGGTDIVEGHVVGRTGGAGADPILFVLGHSNDAAHDSFLFNTTFMVTASFAGTNVVRRGSAVLLDTDELNIGQQVRVFGALSGTAMDASSDSSVIRQQHTRVLGFAAGPDSGGQLTIDLVRVDLRGQDEFTWTDGGTTPPDPDALQLAVGSLGTGLGIEAGSAIEAIGFFSAVDDDAEDFVASSLVNRDHAPSLYLLFDRQGGIDVQVVTDEDSIDFTVTGTLVFGEVAIIDKGFVGALPLPETSSIVQGDGFTAYALRDLDTGQIQLHLEFTEFVQALQAALGSGAVVFNFGAFGIYDEDLATMAANLACVVID